MKKLTFLLALFTFCLFSQKISESDLQSPKFFRCNLDKRPRILVIKLSPTFTLAYDTDKGYLHKAWQHKKTPIKFQGTVYNGKHGPQPVSIGKKNIIANKGALKLNNAKLQYYSISSPIDKKFKDLSVITWHLTRKDNSKIIVHEAARFYKKYIERYFKISGLQKGEIISLELPQNKNWRIKNSPQKLEFKRNRLHTITINI